MNTQNLSKSAKQHNPKIAFNTFVTVCVAVMLFCFSEAKAQNFEFNFDSTKFQVNDGPSYRWLGSTKYKLTDTNPYGDREIIAMWHKDTLDVAKDFCFEFILHFGTGKRHLSNDQIGDGVVFSIHKSIINSNLIGDGH